MIYPSCILPESSSHQSVALARYSYPSWNFATIDPILGVIHIVVQNFQILLNEKQARFPAILWGERVIYVSVLVPFPAWNWWFHPEENKYPFRYATDKECEWISWFVEQDLILVANNSRDSFRKFWEILELEPQPIGRSLDAIILHLPEKLGNEVWIQMDNVYRRLFWEKSPL